ncbi:MAG: ferrous iron transport protein A [Elusimicrobia bacterium]|nr:ferrous iron transport protein A [Elusimicrobiota bacterium]
MTLAAAPFDFPVRVLDCAGLTAHDRERLAGLGLRPGVCAVKLLKTPLRDPIECLVGSQLLAIEARLLPHIRVEPA